MTDQTRKSNGLSTMLSIVVCSLAAAAGYGLYSGRLVVPERFNPWAPLDVMAAPSLLTGYKLERARSDPQRCLAALAQTGMAYDLLPDRVTAPGCGFDNAVRVRQAGVRLGAPLSLSCPMALSFAMWERHTLQPAAQVHFSQRVTAVEHLGSYACRNINRGEGALPDTSGGSRSRHATADALDIAAFTLQNGQQVSVLKAWQRDSVSSLRTPEARLLADAHRGACTYFNGVLGPDYNAVHRDHFHLETGGYAMCR